MISIYCEWESSIIKSPVLLPLLVHFWRKLHWKILKETFSSEGFLFLFPLSFVLSKQVLQKVRVIKMFDKPVPISRREKKSRRDLIVLFPQSWISSYIAFYFSLPVEMSFFKAVLFSFTDKTYLLNMRRFFFIFNGTRHTFEKWEKAVCVHINYSRKREAREIRGLSSLTKH